MAANDKKKPGLLKNAGNRVAAGAGALKAGATAALREKASEFREAIGPEKSEPVKQPERPFGRDEGGEDVKRVVWTGHTVETRGGQAYFGAVGLTQGGYYRAAEVQVYGSGELWRWQSEKHIVKDDAQQSAETMSANRLNPKSTQDKIAPEAAWNTGRESERVEGNKMPIPDNVKAEADARMAESKMEKAPVQDMGGTPAAQTADPYDAKALEAQREQQRQNARDDKAAERGPEPDKG